MANGRYVAELSVETGKLESGVTKAKAALDDLQKKGDMKKLQSSIKDATGLLDNFTSKIGVSTSALSQLATPIGAIGLIGGAITGISVASVKAAADLETLDINLGTLLGSMDKGVALRKELQSYGQSTPYDTEGLANAAKTMLGYGVASERIMPVMKQLGDIAMGNKDHLNALALAYGQMTASGKVMKQDLNQMANAGFGVNQIASSMGVSVGKFFNLLSDGKVKIEDINKALNDATSAGGLFYHSAINSSSTFEGVMSNLGEAAKNTLANIGTSLLPSVKVAAQGLVQVFEFLSSAVQALTSPSESLNNSFGAFGNTIALVRDAISTLFESLGNLYDAVVQVFTEMFAGSGIFESFGTMILTVTKNVIEFVSTIINFTANLIRAAGSTEEFKNHLKTFKNIIDILTSTWNILVKAFKLGVHYIGGVGGSLNTLKNYFTALTGPINWVISRFKMLIDVLKVSMSLINKVLDKKMKEEGIGEKKKTPKKEEKKPSPVITPKPPIKDDGGEEKKKKKKKGKHIKTSAEKIKEAEVKFANDTKEIQNKHKTGYYDNIGDELKDKVKAYDSLIDVYSAEGKAITSLKIKRNALNAQLQAYIKKINDAKKAEDDASKSAEDAVKKREEAIKKANEDSAKALNSDNFGKKTKSEQITENQDDSDKEKNHLTDKIQAIKSQMDELEKVMNDKKDLHLDFKQEEKALESLSEKLKATLKDFKKLEDGRKNIDDFKSALDSFEGQDFQSFKALLKNFQKIMKILNDPKAQVEAYGRELTGIEKGGMAAGSGLQVMGQGLAAIAQGGDAAKAAAIMTAIGQLVLGFATATAQASEEGGPWAWIAFTIAGLATLATTIATITGYANGGIIGGSGTPSGDMGLIRANVGEMVLNKNQQSHLFNMLDKGNVGGGAVTSTVKVRGSDLYLVLNNFSKIKGKSGITTGIK